MQFSDTTNKQGLLQDCEFWCGFADGGITGDVTLKATFTRLINVRRAKTLAKMQLLSGQAGAEDTNYTSQQFSTFDLVSGQNDYQFSVDADGNTISDITGVAILQGSGETEYVPLDRLTLDENDAMLIQSPNASNTGVPTGYIEKNNVIYFNVIPNYSATDGGKLFYRLVPSYFVASDTTKKPGLVEGYDRLLSIGSSLDWLAVNKPEASLLIQSATLELRDLESGLEDFIRQRNPTRARIISSRHSTR